MSTFNKVIVGIIIAITLYWAFGFYAGDAPEDKERIQAQDAVELCREELDSYSGPAAGKNIFSDACQKLEVETRKSLGNAQR